jgi:enoyl-CoA hydratase
VLRKPILAAIDGYCLGGGLEIAMCCDIRVATPRASFGAPEVRRGWHAGSGNTSLLPRFIGYGHAARWILTGDIFPAGEAYRLGLVQEIVEPDDLAATVDALADRIVRNPPIAVESAKNIIRQTQGATIDQALAWENDGYTFCMATEDAAEGIAAFTAKRDPVYRGR